jgi:hypothetical protein
MLDFMQDWPPGLTVLLIVVIAVVPAALGLWLVRRLCPPADLRRGHDVVGFTFNVVGVIYAVLLGFALSNIWGQYSQADEATQMEGVRLHTLYRSSFSLPAPNQMLLRAALTAYARTVVDDEWPLLRRRHDSKLAQAALTQLWKDYYAVEPVSEAQKLWLAESITTLNEMARLRGLRLLAAEQSVSWVMWLLLVIGGVMTCAFMCAFGVERYRAHLMMTAAVAGLILLILYVIYALDNPFWGEPHIKPEAFLRFLQTHPTPE